MLNKELLTSNDTNMVLYRAAYTWPFNNKHSTSTKTFTYKANTTLLAINSMYQCCLFLGGQDTDFYFFPGYTGSGDDFVWYSRPVKDSSMTLVGSDFTRAKWLDSPSDLYSLIQNSNGTIGGITDTGSFRAKVQHDYDDSNAWIGVYYTYWAKEGKGLFGSTDTSLSLGGVSASSIESARIAKFGPD